MERDGFLEMLCNYREIDGKDDFYICILVENENKIMLRRNIFVK